MPVDTMSNKLENKIEKLQRWIKALRNASVEKTTPYCANRFTPEIRDEIIAYLNEELALGKNQLFRYHQWNEERGIKY